MCVDKQSPIPRDSFRPNLINVVPNICQAVIPDRVVCLWRLRKLINAGHDAMKERLNLSLIHI